jgi:hypothetical protein
LAQSFPVTVTQGSTTTISGIYIAPTIAVDKNSVKQGDNLSIFGQTVPTSSVTIQVNSDKAIFAQTFADGDGVYLYNLDTAQLEIGQHSTKSKSVYKKEISDYGATVAFSVTEIALPPDESGCGRADMNCDGRVNLVDFAIAGYWYKRTLSPDFAAIEGGRLSGDGQVNLTDFAIMAFYWTG